MTNAIPDGAALPLHGETLISLAQAASRFPGHRGAERLHPASLTRWIMGGVRAVDGRRVKLEAVRVGYRWLTSEAALNRFAEALATSTEPRANRTPSARNKASEVAAKELEALGA